MATLEVEVIRAQGLVASDLNGKSDPYVKLLVGKRKKTTKTVYKSLNPHWNEVFQFAVLHPDREVLRIEVWDKDSFSRDDFMGRTHVALNSLIRSERGEKWLTLHGGTGSILVALRAINFGIRDTVRVLCVKASSGAIPTYRLTDYDDIGLKRVLDLYCAGDHEEGVTITEVFRTVAGDELATVVHNSGALTGGIRNEVALPPFTVEQSTFRLGTYLWSITVEGTSFTSFTAQYFVNVLKAKKIKHVQPHLALLHSLAPFNRPIVMGPVLQFRGMHCRPQYTNPQRDISMSQSIDMTIKDVLDSFDSDAECPMYHCVAALVVTKHVKGIEAEPALEVSDSSCAVHRHLLYGITEGEDDDAFEAKLWCFEWGIEVTQEEQRVAYRVAMDGEEHRYHYYIPARDRPPAMTATSCNGFDNEENRGVVGLNVENVWRTMLERHMSSPFHLILQGGDQIYADGMIPRIPLLKGWEPRFPLELDVKDPAVAKTFRNIYFRMYCEHWGLPVQRDLFAQIPSCMIWDDHDIFDGWGSYRSIVQDTPSYRFIFKHATEAFSFFQLGVRPDARQPANLPHQHGYSYAHIVGPVCILNLDLRFERSLTSVFSEHSLDGVFQYLDALRERNELLASAAMETVPEVLNLDPMELEDDLKDHWRSPCHRAERLVILHKLFSFAAAAKCRVTIVSGDVHLAALGVLENTAPEYSNSNARSIVQVITSPVMNIPTHGSSLKLTEAVCGGVEKLDEHVVGKMVRMPGKSSKVVSARNYVEMKMEHESNAISVRFILENDPMQPSVDIAPYSETEPLEFVIDK